MVCGFISLPILTRVFSKSEYGALSLVTITLWIALALSKGGQGEAAVKFFTEFKNKKRRCEISVFYSTLFISGIIFALVTSIFFGFFINLTPFKIFNKETENIIWVLIGFTFSACYYLSILKSSGCRISAITSKPVTNLGVGRSKRSASTT